MLVLVCSLPLLFKKRKPCMPFLISIYNTGFGSSLTLTRAITQAAMTVKKPAVGETMKARAREGFLCPERTSRPIEAPQSLTGHSVAQRLCMGPQQIRSSSDANKSGLRYDCSVAIKRPIRVSLTDDDTRGRPVVKVVGWSSREAREEPEGRPGGPGDPKSPRGLPQPFYLSLVLLAFLLALPWPPGSSIKLT